MTYFTYHSMDNCIGFLSRTNVYDVFAYDFQMTDSHSAEIIFKKCNIHYWKGHNSQYTLQFEEAVNGTYINLEYVTEARFIPFPSIMPGFLHQFMKQKLDAVYLYEEAAYIPHYFSLCELPRDEKKQFDGKRKCYPFTSFSEDIQRPAEEFLNFIASWTEKFQRGNIGSKQFSGKIQEDGFILFPLQNHRRILRVMLKGKDVSDGKSARVRTTIRIRQPFLICAGILFLTLLFAGYLIAAKLSRIAGILLILAALTEYAGINHCFWQEALRCQNLFREYIKSFTTDAPWDNLKSCGKIEIVHRESEYEWMPPKLYPTEKCVENLTADGAKVTEIVKKHYNVTVLFYRDKEDEKECFFLSWPEFGSGIFPAGFFKNYDGIVKIEKDLLLAYKYEITIWIKESGIDEKRIFIV